MSKASNPLDFSNLLARCSVSKRFQGARLNHFPTQYQKAGQCGTSLFVTGPRGTGKTHFLCACISKQVENKARSGELDALFNPKKQAIKFLPVPELMLEFKQSYDPDSNLKEGDILEKYARADLLVLDDLGAERVSNWSIQMLYLLIDRRYRDMKQTLISSNLSLSDIAKKLDDRIASRIMETCKIIKFQGKDRRFQNNATTQDGEENAPAWH